MPIKIIFFGSGPVAASSLELLKKDFEVEAVVTKPTTKREMQLAADDAPIYCVSDRKELDALFTTEKFASDVAILIDFGIIVSAKTIDYFSRGIINSHFSLLPELRGADPISFAILEGKTKTGVSLMLLVEAMDEGPILAIGELPLSGKETGESLTRSLVVLSHDLLKGSIPSFVTGEPSNNSGVIPKPLDQESHCNLLNKKFIPTYTRKLTKKDGLIDWSNPAIRIEREIRAFLEWPKSRTTFGDIDCVITAASILDEKTDGEPGSIFIHNKKLAVVCGENALVIDKIKPAGKQEMDIAGFLNGYRDRLAL